MRPCHPGRWRDIIIRTVPAFYAFLAFLLPAFIPIDTLQLWDVKQNKLILCLPVTPAERFSLSYLHSSELSDVTDSFRIDGGEILLFESRFCSHNTGLPSGAEKNEILRRQGDCFKLYNRDIKMRSFDFWAESRYSNRLVLAGVEYALSALPGNSTEKSLIRLTAGRIRLGHHIWRSALP